MEKLEWLTTTNPAPAAHRAAPCSLLVPQACSPQAPHPLVRERAA